MRDNSRMTRALPLLGLTLAALALQGCLARAAVDVVTLPVRAVSAGVDAVTTSQSEADEKRGRELREREERIGKLEREYNKQIARCREGDSKSCDKAQSLKAEWEALIAGEPND